MTTDLERNPIFIFTAYKQHSSMLLIARHLNNRQQSANSRDVILSILFFI